MFNMHLYIYTWYVSYTFVCCRFLSTTSPSRVGFLREPGPRLEALKARTKVMQEAEARIYTNIIYCRYTNTYYLYILIYLLYSLHYMILLFFSFTGIWVHLHFIACITSVSVSKSLWFLWILMCYSLLIFYIWTRYNDTDTCLFLRYYISNWCIITDSNHYSKNKTYPSTHQLSIFSGQVINGGDAIVVRDNAPRPVRP